jgi:hypothetical protein
VAQITQSGASSMLTETAHPDAPIGGVARGREELG